MAPRAAAALVALLLLAGCHWLLPFPAARDAARGDADTGSQDRPVASDQPDEARRDGARDGRGEAVKVDHGPPVCGNKICEPGEHCPACGDCCGCDNVDCGAATVKCTGAGSITSPAGSFKVAPALPFGWGVILGSAPAGKVGMRLHLCGLDLSQVTYTGKSWLNTTDLGANLSFGLASTPPENAYPGRPANGIWFEVTSATPGTDAYWDGTGPYTNSDGFRKYNFQTWYPTLSALGQQYNIEHGAVAGAKYIGADVFDLRLEMTPQGGPSFKYQAWTRLHVSSAKIDGCSWAWNDALNTQTPDAAWLLLKKWPGGTVDYETATLSPAGGNVYIWAASGGNPANTGYTITWAGASLELPP
jgi:hypothetical protein